jgi:hypothetical protein
VRYDLSSYQRLLRHYFPARWAPPPLELGDTSQEQTLGIKMTGEGYQSDTAAQFAGKQALAVFLTDLAKERLPRSIPLLISSMPAATACSRVLNFGGPSTVQPNAGRMIHRNGRAGPPVLQNRPSDAS